MLAATFVHIINADFTGATKIAPAHTSILTATEKKYNNYCETHKRERVHSKAMVLIQTSSKIDEQNNKNVLH